MRIDQLTFTRFLAAILIVVFHYGDFLFPFNTSFLSVFISQANVGVSYFFILSGFVMVIAYGNQDKINAFAYLQNRLLRVYPIYFLSLVLIFIYRTCILLVPIGYYGLFLNVTLMKAWIPAKATSFNSPGWTLSVEFFFYVLFPFLFNYIYNKKDNKKQFALYSIFFWIASQLALHAFIYSACYKGYPSESHNFIYYWPLMHLNEFLIGNLAGLFFIYNWKTQTKNYDWQIAGVLIVMAVVLKYHGPLIFHNGLLAVFFVPLILLLSLNTGWITKVMKNKRLVFLGEISFSVYILQVPIYALCTWTFDQFTLEGDNLRFYLFLLVLICFSSLTYLLIESPVRNKFRKSHR